MTTATNYSPEALENSSVVDSDGNSIGQVGQVYLDHHTGKPTWVTVKTGWFGTNEPFVPLASSSIQGDTIRVPYSKDMIKGAPINEVGVPLAEADERGLYSYYGIGNGHDDMGHRGTSVDNEAAPDSAEPADYLTRSEERLHVRTEKVETGRARLRKFVVTEDQSVTVPVSHEEVRLVREPMAPGDGEENPTIAEAATDAVLTEERVVVDKETVPVEKVHLGTETVTEQRQVTEAVRKEEIEFDDGNDGAEQDYDSAPDGRPAN